MFKYLILFKLKTFQQVEKKEKKCKICSIFVCFVERSFNYIHRITSVSAAQVWFVVFCFCPRKKNENERRKKRNQTRTTVYFERKKEKQTRTQNPQFVLASCCVATDALAEKLESKREKKYVCFSIETAVCELRRQLTPVVTLLSEDKGRLARLVHRARASRSSDDWRRRRRRRCMQRAIRMCCDCACCFRRPHVLRLRCCSIAALMCIYAVANNGVTALLSAAVNNGVVALCNRKRNRRSSRRSNGAAALRCRSKNEKSTFLLCIVSFYICFLSFLFIFECLCCRRCRSHESRLYLLNSANFVGR